MDSLVAQPGEALLSFGEPANGSITVSQSRFFLSPSGKPDPAQKWTLPVCFKTGNPALDNAHDCEVLTPSSSSLTVHAGEVVFANAGGKGYFRSAYPPSAYAALVTNVESGLTPVERIRFIGDEWA
jgi:hypothetical protein